MTSPQPVPLCDLAVGDTARVHRADVTASMARYLRAIGLTNASEFRLCKTGEPCIIQVRATRIGLSRGIARHILVVPLSEKSG